jgi:phage-related tail protein
MALVGEKGPEVVRLPRGSQVIPNHKIRAYADGTPGYARSYGGSSHSTSIGELHVHAHGVNDPGSFARQAVALIPHELKRQSSSFSPYSH